MNKVLPFILDYYDREVSQMISKKYGFSIMEAYKMLLQPIKELRECP
mgnify:CR=1 FL=1